MGYEPGMRWGRCPRGFANLFTGWPRRPHLFPFPGPFSPRSLLPASCGSPGQNKGDLDEVVMPGIWEVTLGEEGAGMRQEIGLKPPKGPDCPWEVGALEPGRLGQSAILWRRPRPAPKSTPSLPDLCNRDPSGPSIFRPLKDQCSFPAVSYKCRADTSAQEEAAAHSRPNRS